jgi:saccharopine dehydrogenase (NADP+, L-glutamate forming)
VYISYIHFSQSNKRRTRPTAEILGNSGVKVVVACRTLERAKSLANGIKNATAISVS